MSLATAAYAATANPVSKVVTVLEKMKVQLETEEATDRKTSEKMKCWCDKTITEKTEAIAKANADIEALTGLISELTGAIAQLTQEIEALEKSIVEEQESLAMATHLRMKENKKFNKIEKELVQSVSGLQAAVQVLKKHQSFMQKKDFGGLKTIVSKADLTSLSIKQQKLLTAFVSQPSFHAYSSQSGEIFAILGQMLENFQEDLTNARADEKAASESYVALKVTKEKNLKVMTKSKDEKEVLSGKKLEEKERATEDLEVTTEKKEKDEKFLANTEAECSKFSADHEARQEERKTELEAVSTALEYLGSDEARDLFARTFTGSFIQLSSKHTSANKAAMVLLESGRRLHNPMMTVLAQGVKAGVFEPVLAQITAMIGDLKQQMETDVADKDACVMRLNELTGEIKQLEREQFDLETKKATLEEQIVKLDEQLEQLHAEIEQIKKDLDEASGVRSEENAQHQEENKNGSDTIELLQKTLDVLKQVYAVMPVEPVGSAVVAPAEQAFLQQPGEAPSTEGKPDEWKQLDKNAGGAKVLSLIGEILADAQKAKALGLQAEADAQAAYEQVVQDSNASIDAAEKSINEKSEDRASKMEELASTEDSLGMTNSSLETTVTTRKNKADECQFLMNNFDLRQDHHQQEIDALNEAAAFLQNMK